MLKNERNKYKEGLVGKFETTKEGGNLLLTYDLSVTNVRLNVNSIYLHNNLYLKPIQLAEYLKKNGYNCSVDLANYK